MRYAHEAGRPSPRLEMRSPANLFIPASNNLYAAVCAAARGASGSNVRADPAGRPGSWVPMWIYLEVRRRGKQSTRHAPVP